MKKATFSGTKSILCKILLCLTALMLAAGTAFAEDTSSESPAGIEISFTLFHSSHLGLFFPREVNLFS